MGSGLFCVREELLIGAIVKIYSKNCCAFVIIEPKNGGAIVKSDSENCCAFVKKEICEQCLSEKFFRKCSNGRKSTLLTTLCFSKELGV